VLVAKNNLASVFQQTNQLDKAIELNKEVLAARQRTLGKDHPRTLASMNNLGTDYLKNEQYEQAESTLTATLELCQARLGEADQLTRYVMLNLARTYNQTDPEKAVTLWEDVVQKTIAAKVDPLSVMAQLAQAYQATDRVDDAIQLYIRALDLCNSADSAPCEARLPLMSVLASAYLRKGNPKAAATLLTDVVAAYDQDDPDSRSPLFEAQRSLVICHLGLRDFDLAETTCRELIEFLTDIKATKTSGFAHAKASLASCLIGGGKLVEAEAAASAAVASKKIRPFDRARAQLVQILVKPATDPTALSQAIVSIERMEAALDDVSAKHLPLFQLCCERVIKLCDDRGEKELAAEWKSRMTVALAN
jgi:tetratricopeptide (TPR) repeat protein